MTQRMWPSGPCPQQEFLFSCFALQIHTVIYNIVIAIVSSYQHFYWPSIVTVWHVYALRVCLVTVQYGRSSISLTYIGDDDQKDVEEEICVMVNNSSQCLSKLFGVCLFFLNSASWGAIPSVCFVRCTCALKYNIIILIIQPDPLTCLHLSMTSLGGRKGVIYQSNVYIRQTSHQWAGAPNV